MIYRHFFDFCPGMALKALVLTVGTVCLTRASQGQETSLAFAYSDPTFFAVSVSDLEDSVDWYTRVLGLTTMRSVEGRDGQNRAIMLRRDEFVVELIEYSGSIGFTDVLPSTAHRFALQGFIKAGIFAEDIESFHSHLLGSDVDADQTIVHDAVLNRRTFVFRDPDGNRIQVFGRCREACSR